MSRFGRRTFLGSSAGVAAGVAGAGLLPAASPASGAEDAEWPLTRVAALAGPSGPLRAGGLTVNGAVDPVGVDPDDCSFAWTLHASGRERATDGVPRHCAAHRPGSRRRHLGQRSGAVGPPGVRRLRGSTAGGRRGVRVDRAGTR